MTDQSTAILSALSPLLGSPCMLLADEHRTALFGRAHDLARRDGLPTVSPRPSRQPLAVGTDVAGPAGWQPSVGAKVVVVPLVGVLTKAPSAWNEIDVFMGYCPTAPLAEVVRAATDDESVVAIVLDVDSPGGVVNGAVELADAVAAAATIKPVVAVVRGYCCSGAYWIPSQANQIVSRPECLVGNIGVYTVLTDLTKMLDAIGVELTTVSSGAFKGQGADKRVTPEYVQDTQRIVSGIYQQFTSAVAAGRGMDPAKVAGLSDGRAFLGTEARSNGLVDGIASTFDAAIEQFLGSAAVAPRLIGANTMSSANTTAADPRAAAEDDQAEPNPDSNADMRAAMAKQTEAADAHKQRARAVQDMASSFQGEPNDETKAAASTMKASVKAAHAEGNRALAACRDMMGGGDDDEGADDDTAAAAGTDPVRATLTKTAVAATSADYMAAFGDKGARWFIEQKPFAQACIEHIDGLKAAHATELSARDATVATRDTTIADLTTKLDALKASNGNDPVSFSASDKGAPAIKAKATGTVEKTDGKYSDGTPIGKAKGTGRFADSIVMPGKSKTNV